MGGQHLKQMSSVVLGVLIRLNTVEPSHLGCASCCSHAVQAAEIWARHQLESCSMILSATSQTRHRSHRPATDRRKLVMRVCGRSVRGQMCATKVPQESRMQVLAAIRIQCLTLEDPLKEASRIAPLVKLAAPLLMRVLLVKLAVLLLNGK